MNDERKKRKNKKQKGANLVIITLTSLAFALVSKTRRYEKLLTMTW
jgi:hypothetical protein